MKNLVFTAILTIACLSAFSQKLTKNEVDKYTQETHKVTSKEKIWRNVALGGLVDVYAEKDGSRYFLWLVRHERSIFSVTQGDLLYIALANGQSIKLKCASNVIAKYGENLWHGSAAYRVTESDLAAIKSSGATGIRIDQTSDYVTKDIKEKFQFVIGDCLRLVE